MRLRNLLIILAMPIVGCAQLSKDAYYEPESSPQQWNCNHWNGSESCQLMVSDARVFLDISDRAHQVSWMGILVPFIPASSGESGTPDSNVLNIAMCWNLKSGENIDVDLSDIAVVQNDGTRLQGQEIADRIVRNPNGTLNKHLIDGHIDTTDSKCIDMLFKSSGQLDSFSLVVPKLAVNGTVMTPDPLLMRLRNGTHYDYVPIM